MASETLLRKRVSVQQDPYCFLVLVDAKPVLRCTARRDALRYAVLVRRALRRAASMVGERTPVNRQSVPRKILN